MYLWQSKVLVDIVDRKTCFTLHTNARMHAPWGPFRHFDAACREELFLNFAIRDMVRCDTLNKWFWTEIRSAWSIIYSMLNVYRQNWDAPNINWPKIKIDEEKEIERKRGQEWNLVAATTSAALKKGSSEWNA